MESACMKIGKDSKGLIVKTTQEKAVRIWALSQNLCGELMAENKTNLYKTQGRI